MQHHVYQTAFPTDTKQQIAFIHGLSSANHNIGTSFTVALESVSKEKKITL